MQVNKKTKESVYHAYQVQLRDFERRLRSEKTYLKRLQTQIAEVMRLYMSEESIGFNELVRRLDMSPTKVSNIKNSRANLTLASVARLFSLIDKEPNITGLTTKDDTALR